MSGRARVITVWTVAGVLSVVLLAGTVRPLWIAWHCYTLNASGERADAEVVKKLEPPTLVLQIASGPGAGQACTAKTSEAHHAALEIGDPIPVVYRAEVPGECVLVATLENSAVVLWAFVGGVASALLLIFAGAMLVHRSLTATPILTSYMDVDGKRLACPRCGVEMDEGYLALLSGVHWRDPGEPIGIPHALSGMPGTVARRVRPRLHAFRCRDCSIVTFRYGMDPRSH